MKDFSETTTIGQIFGPAMEITDPIEAQKYFEKLIEYSIKFHGKSREEAIKIQKSNLGYYAGYYSDKTRKRVEELFNCAHSIFGSIKEKGLVIPKEAVNAGKKIGEKINEKY